MNIQSICFEIVALSKEVGLYLREENKHLLKSGVESKGDNNFVTYIDKESERRLIAGLTAILPEAGFLTEEGSVELKGEDYFWIVDPLDGTTNYIHQLPPYSISIGLMHKNEIILGCVYEVTLDEAFYAWQGGGAWLNNEKIKISSHEKVKNSMIAYGIPYNVESKYEYLRQSIPGFHGVCTLRHMGSAAAEICYVAAGRTDAYFHDNLSPWDVAGGVIILQEAGGQVTDLNFGNNYIFGKELVASNGLIHRELMNALTLYKK